MIASNNANVENKKSGDTSAKERFRGEIEERLAYYENANPLELTFRLAELDKEWDIERILEFTFSSAVLAGIMLGKLSNRKWYLLPTLAACFMMQHVMKGRSSPLFFLRHLGFRTAGDIIHERTALKVLRGDFAHLGVPGTHGTSTSVLLSAIEEKG